MKKQLLTLTLLAATLTGFSQDVNKLIQQNDVERIIKTLTADDMQGRATFTPGIEKAAQFIESEYKKIGLQHMPGNTGYRQNFTMLKSTPVKTLASINGAVVPAEKVFAAGSASFEWANNADVQVSKISSDKNFIAEYRAALGSDKKMLILVDPTFEAIFKRIQGFSARGSVSFKSGGGKPEKVFVLSDAAEVKNFQVSYTVNSQELPLFNVAGVIPGKSKPNEYVVFSGHYDHLGIIKPVEGDSIANGADDDASGTTAVLTLAKYYKKLNNNARTLIFVAFTAEEIGEYGSTYFATQVKPDEVKAMFNIEMIGKASKFGENSAFITGYERSDFGKILQRNLEGTAFKFYPDPYPQQDLFYRSDNASLARVGVPAHTISTDQIDVDKFYHTVKDELSTLDVANITSTIRAIALSSRTIVDGKDTPTRVPKLER
jgi:hypothetical protein